MNRLFLYSVIFLVGVAGFFFKDFFVYGKLPIPADTIVGLYHPFRDLYAPEFPRGIPYKNFLITDPVRQEYLWRELAIDNLKQGKMPLWNPYSMGGYPLLGNLQSSPFYFLNILFFVFPFATGWGVMIFLQTLGMLIFMYLYLRNLALGHSSSILGALAFSFSGFSIAWLEWGTVLHVALWLPLILLSIDKIVVSGAKDKISLYFAPVFVFALCSSFFAGHLQTFFYLFVFILLYFLVRWFQNGKNLNILSLFFVLITVSAIVTAIQWIPTVQLILESARNLDQADWHKEGWFIPFKHLVQFVAPDFFGNPTTLNYWGAWNYAELVSYIGIIPLLFTFSIIKDKKINFFLFSGVIALFLSFPNTIAELPFRLEIPFLASAQPTRLLFLVDFFLSVIAAFGLQNILSTKNKKQILFPILLFTTILAILWGIVFFGKDSVISLENLSVSKSNLILPTGIFVLSSFFLISMLFFFKKGKTNLILGALIMIAVFDLLRFGIKFTPFSSKEYLFPQTKTTQFLQENIGNYRMMSLDDRILPPNFSVVYRLQSIDGYDPLYLLRYGEFVAALERKKPDISTPFGFNRIITPKNYGSKFIDMMGVKYILSLSEIESSKLKKVFQEGQTRVYENYNVLPRVFFVEEILLTTTKEDSIKKMYNESFDPRKQAVVELGLTESIKLSGKKIEDLLVFKSSSGSAQIVSYKENSVKIKTYLEDAGFLVLTDTYYPTWKVKIDGKNGKIFRTNYNFRGVIVPEGEHAVEFYTVFYNY